MIPCPHTLARVKMIGVRYYCTEKPDGMFRAAISCSTQTPKQTWQNAVSSVDMRWCVGQKSQRGWHLSQLFRLVTAKRGAQSLPILPNAVMTYMSCEDDDARHRTSVHNTAVHTILEESSSNWGGGRMKKTETNIVLKHCCAAIIMHPRRHFWVAWTTVRHKKTLDVLCAMLGL